MHGIFATDALETKNFKADDQGLDELTSPHVNINTGDRIYALYRFHSVFSMRNAVSLFSLRRNVFPSALGGWQEVL